MLNGIQQVTWDGLTSIAKACGSGCVDISGGTEAGHDASGSHGAGTGVDILPNDQLTKYMASIGAQPTVGVTQAVTINGKSAHVLYEVTNTQVSTGGSVSSGPHWHISF